MELLAPAGNMEALFQAVCHKADAVYLGYTAFSARQSAGNFTKEELISAVSLCHRHSVRVYVTVNTLVKQSEMDGLLDALQVISDAMADAVIVQDIGVVRLIQRHFPHLPIHASTQMALHNVQGVRFAKRMGLNRVVMARECSLNEIKKAAKEGLPLEVFVHGAMCISQSGQCLFSSMVGGRSGNRGRCAQPCRMDYTFEKKHGAFLSPRDIMLREELDTLKDAGVAALKIEGRLKRSEYVAAVTQSYRRALDGESLGKAEEKAALMQIFNRGGFMKGHLLGDEDAAICFPERVNHMGVDIGSVVGFHNGFARIALDKPLHNGDGLQLRDGRDTDLIYSGKDALAGETVLCRLREDASVKLGATVARLTDQKQMEKYNEKQLPKIPVDMSLHMMPGEPMRLTVSGVTVTGDIVQTAKNAPLSHDALRQALQKTGGTEFEAESISVYSENAFMPMAAINALRRDALNAYAAHIEKAFYLSGEKAARPELLPAKVPTLLHCKKAIRSSDPANFEADTLNLFEPTRFDAQALDALTCPAWLCLPPMCEADTLDAIVALAEKRKDVISGLVLGSMGQLGIQTTLPLAASEGLPAWNRLAAQALIDMGCQFIIASPELSGEEYQLLDGFPLIVPTYGRIRLMVLSHCPRRTALGLTKGRQACRLCEQTPLPPLIDRKGIAFPLARTVLPEGCRIHVLSDRPLNLIGRHDFIPLYTLNTHTAADQGSTTGHFMRPVE